MKKYLRHKKWYKIIKESRLFDVKYYLFTYPDVRQKRVDPIKHFIKFGVYEGRNPSAEFDTNFYLNTYIDVKESGMNPLVHYIIYGINEGRTIRKALKQTPAFKPVYTVKKQKKIVKKKLINETQKEKLMNLKKINNTNIAVIFHIFCPNLIKEIASYLNNIQFNYVLIVTYPKEKTESIKPFLKVLAKHRLEIEVENYGYDILPFLQLLPILDEVGFEYFCKIHTKLDHDDPLISRYWRESLLDGILGSKKLVNDIITAFNNNHKLYMVGSKINYLSYQARKYDNKKNVQKLAKKLNISLSELDDFGFIAGTMFWGRIKEFLAFSKIKIDLGDGSQQFSGQASSIFHVFERIFGILTLKNYNIGLVDYDISYKQAIPYLEIQKQTKPLILQAKHRYQAYRNRKKYFEYLLLLKTHLLDEIWSYNNYPDLIKSWKNCVFEFLDGNIDCLSRRHKDEVLNLDFYDNRLEISYNDGKRETIILESNSLCENLLPCKKYRKSQLNYNSNLMVSVICVTYNHEKYIEQALKSIATQKTTFDFEILVGDDCSTDNTANIIKKVAQKYPNRIIPILRDKNIGTRNNQLDLFRRAKGKYMAFNDGDDYWIDKYKLQTQVDYMETHKECSVCAHFARDIDEDNRNAYYIFPQNIKGNKFNIDTLIHGNLMRTNSVMYRGNILKEVFIADDLMPRDWYRHILNSLYGEIHIIPKVMSAYRKHQGGIWSKKSQFYKSYDLEQIVFYQEVNNITDKRFHNMFLEKQLNIFNELYWNYFGNNDVKSIYNLITRFPNLSKLYFKSRNIKIDICRISSENDLKAQYKNMYKINVVVTSYNHEKYIKQTLESIMKQKGLFSIKLILADDSSTDKTYEIIKELTKNYKGEVFLFEKGKNVGLMKNMQRAFKVCDGQFTAICEGDDYWTDELKLSKQLVFMLRKPSYSMCFNLIWLDYIDKRIRKLHPGQMKIKGDAVSFETILKTALTANFSCCFYRTSNIKRIPKSYYEQNISIDWLFNLYMSIYGKVGFIKEPMSVYRIRDNAQWSGLSEEERKERKQKSYKYFLSLFPGYSEIIENLIISNHKEHEKVRPFKQNIVA